MFNKKNFLDEANTNSKKITSILGQPDVDDEQTRQIFGAFLFGVFNALAYEMKASPVDVHSAMIELSINTLMYTPEQAAEFCQYLINCTDKENNPTTFAIIHRGIDGYYQLKELKEEELKDNYCEIVQIIKDAQ